MIGIDQLILGAKLQRVNDGLELITQNSYGYGDIIRLVSYATQIQKMYKIPVAVKFIVTHKKIDLSENIFKILNHYDLDIDYQVCIGTLEEYANKYCNLLKLEYAKMVREMLGCPKLKTKHKPEEHNHIAVWHHYKNLKRPESYKIPFTKKQFWNFVSEYDNIKFVDYRMDIKRVFSVIRTAKLCVGYEGLGQQIAYHYNKQIVTLSTNKDVSINTGGPESYITDNLNDVRNIISERRNKNDWD